MPGGLPPLRPSNAIRIPLTAAVPAALSARSRATSQRRASEAMATRTTTTPIDPAWYTTVTSHVMLHGGGWMTCTMAWSTRESKWMTSRQTTRARTARTRRAPSLPRRRRWPSPTGAKKTERQPRRGCASGTEPVLLTVSSTTRANFLAVFAGRHLALGIPYGPGRYQISTSRTAPLVAGNDENHAGQGRADRLRGPFRDRPGLAGRGGGLAVRRDVPHHRGDQRRPGQARGPGPHPPHPLPEHPPGVRR